jgi:ABC-2 type transport system permease protein
LTSEKRYTLSASTVKIIKSVDDIVFIKVFLEGDFPAGFKRLRRETKELLDEFRAYNKNIQYEFINPSESEDPKERNDTYKLLMEQGLNPTNLQVKTKNGLQEQVIFPGAIVSYHDKQIPVELLDAQINVPPEAVLNRSIQNLEYKFLSAIFKLTRKHKPAIAFIEGHGELNKNETWDITNTLKNDYAVSRISIDSNINSLVKRELTDSIKEEYKITPKYSAIIIAKPMKKIPEKDKFIIDQYIMWGGKVLWLIDPVIASMDSIQNSESTMAIDNPTGLQELLFRYGVRINKDLVMDLNALPIPIKTGQMGSQPQISFFPWYYFPVITPTSKNPIVRNLNAIKTQFVSSEDTVNVKGVKKTILLKTSPYSRTVNVPAMISLAIAGKTPDKRLYSGPPQNIAILLEGVFPSDFANRIPPEIAESKMIGFREKSKPTAMIVVTDGDIIRNQFKIPDGYPLPLGYDQFTKQTFGNKDFILNTIDYLTDGPELISVRTKEVKLRLLDKSKLNEELMKWQLLNVSFPLLIVILSGLLMIWLRKRKYTK